MSDLSYPQIQQVSNFHDLVSTPFHGEQNALCWSRNLLGDFSEIIKKVELNENLKTLKKKDLYDLELSEQGQLARDIILNDFQLLEDHGADPILNVIKNYDRDDLFFPTDVYSFHVDRSPIPTDTFLCTYYGASSEIIPNSQAEQKILVPEIRNQLKELFNGPDHEFEAFLSEYFFDLHYQAKPNAQITKLGVGHLWRLATDHPENKSLPCVHRAPIENVGENRLLMIC